MTLPAPRGGCYGTSLVTDSLLNVWVVPEFTVRVSAILKNIPWPISCSESLVRVKVSSLLIGQGSTADGNIVEFAEFIVRLDLHGVCVVNEPETIDLSNAVDCTLEDLVDMDFQDNNIVFALNLVKLEVQVLEPESPLMMIWSSTYCSVLAEFEPDLLTVNIYLLGFKSVALAEVEFFAGLESVLVIAVKNELCELV